MKKVIAIAAALVLLLTACTAGGRGSGLYALAAVVTGTDQQNDIVTVEDYNGNTWAFYGVEDWQPGDCAALLMDDNGTETIYDDAIISARYGAWTMTR